MPSLTSAFVNTVWNIKKIIIKKKKKNGAGRMHVTSKYIVHRTWGDLWSLPSGTKIAINLGRLVGCRTLDLPHFKSSVERCGITMLEWNQLFVYKTPSKNCFRFRLQYYKGARAINENDAVTNTIWTVSLFLWRRIMLQYVGLFWTDQGIVEQISRGRAHI